MPAMTSHAYFGNPPERAIRPWSLSASWLLGLTALAFVLGVYEIGAKSLWVDEGLSAAIARMNPADVVRAAWSTPTPGAIVLYYELLAVWAHLGLTETNLRLLSAICAALSVPVMYALALRLSGRRTAQVSALLVAISPFVVRYSQEARPYALVFLLSAASSLALVRAIDKSTWGRWAAYWALGTAGLYTHNTFAFLLAAHVVVVAILAPSRGRWLIRPICSFLAIVVAAFPLLGLFISPATQISFVPKLSYRSVGQTLTEVAGGTRTLFAIQGIACLAALGLAARAWRRKPMSFWALVILGAAPIGAELLLSVARPIFLQRYAMIAYPGIAMIVAAGIAEIRWKPALYTALAVLVFASAEGLYAWYFHSPKEGWQEAVAAISANAQPGDGIIVYPEYARLPFDYYMVRALDAAELHPVFPTPAWGAYFPALAGGRPWTTVLESHPRSIRRVWIVARYALPTSGSPNGRSLSGYLHGAAIILRVSFTQVTVELAEWSDATGGALETNIPPDETMAHGTPSMAERPPL